jgi:cytochrome oxidase Cu insertion factor (SCO1/SenC/PrrC family)
MADLRRRLAPRSDWRFLTARDTAKLAPVLRDFGQDAVPELTAEGTDSGVVRHVVKVFLVDAQGGVRNIYSTGFLDHRLVLRDVETLLLSE